MLHERGADAAGDPDPGGKGVRLFISREQRGETCPWKYRESPGFKDLPSRTELTSSLPRKVLVPYTPTHLERKFPLLIVVNMEKFSSYIDRSSFLILYLRWFKQLYIHRTSLLLQCKRVIDGVFIWITLQLMIIVDAW